MTDLSAWPALVLTAGLGMRLRPLSQLRAKAAVPIGDEVLVRHVLRWLHRAGIRRVVLNLHHRAETVTPHVGDGRDLGLEVRYSWESQVLGSAGGPRRALPLLDAARFLIVNGDTLTDASLAALTARHITSGARVTMTVTGGDTRYGGVLVDAEDCVHGFAPAVASPTATLESPPTATPLTRGHFVGIQAVDRDVFEELPDNTPSESVWGIYPGLIAERRGALRVYRTSAEFNDIGTPADYLATVHRLAGGQGNHIGPGSVVAASALLTGSVLWDRVTVGPDAVLTDCVVGDDVTIPAGARHARQAIVVSDGQLIISQI